MSHIYMITQLEMQYLIIHILMIILLVQPTLITKAQLTKKICTEQNFRDTDFDQGYIDIKIVIIT